MEWENVGRRALENMYYDQQLSDREIGEKFDVSKEQVKYRRKKYKVTFQGKMLKQFADNNEEVLKRLDEDAKGRMLDIKDTDEMAALLRIYAFRNGPLSGLYEEGRLSREEYKAIEDFTAGRLAGILDAVCKGEWLKLELLLKHYADNMRNLEPVVPDREELEIVFMNYIE